MHGVTRTVYLLQWHLRMNLDQILNFWMTFLIFFKSHSSTSVVNQLIKKNICLFKVVEGGRGILKKQPQLYTSLVVISYIDVRCIIRRNGALSYNAIFQMRFMCISYFNDSKDAKHPGTKNYFDGKKFIYFLLPKKKIPF